MSADTSRDRSTPSARNVSGRLADDGELAVVPEPLVHATVEAALVLPEADALFVGALSRQATWLVSEALWALSRNQWRLVPLLLIALRMN